MAVKEFRIWSDNAVRFVPRRITAEEDHQLVNIALQQQPVKQTLEVSNLLLARAAEEPDRPFLPTLWVKEELSAS